MKKEGWDEFLIIDMIEIAFGLDIQILRDVDRFLYGRGNGITSDSAILDHCVSWVNLAAECMKEKGIQSVRLWD